MRDASSSLGYVHYYAIGTHLYTYAERFKMDQSFLSRGKQPRHKVDREQSKFRINLVALTTRPPRLDVNGHQLIFREICKTNAAIDGNRRITNLIKRLNLSSRSKLSHVTKARIKILPVRL